MSFEDILEATLERVLRRVLEEQRPRAESPDELLTVAEASKLAKVHPDTVRQWIQDGLLKRYGSAGAVRVRREDVLSVRPRSDGLSAEEIAARMMGKAVR